jgi:putative thioredoxin
MNITSNVIDVTDNSFQFEVLERSREMLVVVDFWAEWCGPCRQLGPVLEQLALENQGRMVLAKLNVDQSPRIAGAFQVESIPAVKAFKNGQIVAEFTGALPEPRVRQWLDSMLPSRADDLAAYGYAVLEQGKLDTAIDAFREALEEAPGHLEAAIGLGAALIEKGDTDVARSLLEPLAHDDRARALLASLRFAEATTSADTTELEARLQADPRDVDAHYKIAQILAAREDWPAALTHLLEVVRLDRTYDDDAGRRDAIDIFTLLGDDSPITQEYRQRLSMILF